MYRENLDGKLGQGVEYALDNKGTKSFDWWSLAKDAFIGGVTCGLGNVANGVYKGIKVGTKVAAAAKLAADPRAQALVQTGAQIAGGRNAWEAIKDGAIDGGVGFAKGKLQGHLNNGAVYDSASNAWATGLQGLAKQNISLTREFIAGSDSGRAPGKRGR